MKELGLKGVSWCPVRNKWRAGIWCPIRGNSFLGRYNDPYVAASAVKAARAYIDCYGDLFVRHRIVIRDTYQCADKLALAELNRM